MGSPQRLGPHGPLVGARRVATGLVLTCLLAGRSAAGSPEQASAPRPVALAAAGAAARLAIPHARYRLPNGLTVILHQDRTQPLCVVNVSYQVGSRDERVGRTGLAHLFEHLMFMGTRRVPEKMLDEWMEREGGWNNAWTSQDRTGFYSVAPAHALPLLLWMEADRMAALGPELDQRKLAAQRDVVRNERREQIENQPYAAAELRLPELLFPGDHPYHHPIIGAHADLEAATVADVREYFSRFYGPSNATLVVGGDFDEQTVRQLIESTLGRVPASSVPPRPATVPRPSTLQAVVRESLDDQISLPEVILAWPSPPLYAPGDAELDLLAAVAGSGKASRLYRALVYEQRIAQTVSVSQRSLALASTFQIEVTARPGVSLDELERATVVELERLRREPIAAHELHRAQVQYETRFVSGLQSLVERVSALATYQAQLGTPDWVQQDLDRYLRASPERIRATAERVLAPGARVVLRIVPKSAAPPAATAPGAPTGAAGGAP